MFSTHPLLPTCVTSFMNAPLRQEFIQNPHQEKSKLLPIGCNPRAEQNELELELE